MEPQCAVCIKARRYDRTLSMAMVPGMGLLTMGDWTLAELF